MRSETLVCLRARTMWTGQAPPRRPARRLPSVSLKVTASTEADPLLCSSRLFLLREPPRPVLCGAGVTTWTLLHTSVRQLGAEMYMSITPLASRTARRDAIENSSEPQNSTLNGPRAEVVLYRQDRIAHCRRATRIERSASMWTCSDLFCSAQPLPDCLCRRRYSWARLFAAMSATGVIASPGWFTQCSVRSPFADTTTSPAAARSVSLHLCIDCPPLVWLQRSCSYLTAFSTHDHIAIPRTPRHGVPHIGPAQLAPIALLREAPRSDDRGVAGEVLPRRNVDRADLVGKWKDLVCHISSDTDKRICSEQG